MSVTSLYTSNHQSTIRTKFRRLLARFDYPPDAEASAIELVLGQAELVAGLEWE